ncbi:hypothetical protein PYW07_010131 [Mythimna separata]|uniref:ZAD domain-containing protein n=1 Tax=Mythimna separata TaxID=271217 RepID=A0AAD7YIJ5_MYTSE|nr:hypothetical protein PYW07_010131 [Mythimna separata]
MNSRSSTSAGEDSAGSTSLDENSREKVGIKKEQNDDSICRVCLKEGCVPIFENKTAEDLAESLNTFAGIEIRTDDPYPKYLCQPCYTLLQGAILFRKTAQQSDEILKQPTEDLLTADNDDSYDYPEDDDNNSWEYEHKDKKKKTYYCKKCEISFDSYKEYADHKQTEEHENKKEADDETSAKSAQESKT